MNISLMMQYLNDNFNDTSCLLETWFCYIFALSASNISLKDSKLPSYGDVQEAVKSVLDDNQIGMIYVKWYNTFIYSILIFGIVSSFGTNP